MDIPEFLTLVSFYYKRFLKLGQPKLHGKMYKYFSEKTIFLFTYSKWYDILEESLYKNSSYHDLLGIFGGHNNDGKG